MSANSIGRDGTQHVAASHLDLFCLPISHKKDARLIWVKVSILWPVPLTYGLLHAKSVGFASSKDISMGMLHLMGC